MTYGRAINLDDLLRLRGAAVSHLAELVRGDFLACKRRPPHTPLRGTFSHWGEGLLLFADHSITLSIRGRLDGPRCREVWIDDDFACRFQPVMPRLRALESLCMRRQSVGLALPLSFQLQLDALLWISRR